MCYLITYNAGRFASYASAETLAGVMGYAGLHARGPNSAIAGVQCVIEMARRTNPVAVILHAASPATFDLAKIGVGRIGCARA